MKNNKKDKFMETNDSTNIYSINQVIRPKEEILYSCRPNAKAFFFSQLFKMSPFVVIWLCFDIFAIVASFSSMQGVDIGMFFILLVFFGVHLTPVWVWLYGFIKDISECKHTEYAITNERVIIKGGPKAKDLIFIQLKNIQALNVHIGIFDSLFKVGDLYITSDKEIAVIFDIKDAKQLMHKIYEIAKEEKMKMQVNSKTEYKSPLQNMKR